MHLRTEGPRAPVIERTPLLRVSDLHVSFKLATGRSQVLKGISFRIRNGSTVAVVGESGSGKSVTAQAIMGLLPRNATIDAGRIEFFDPKSTSSATPSTTPRDLAKLDVDSAEFRAVRGARISMIFQEPMTSLSPLHTVGNQVSEMLEIHQGLSRKAAESRVVDMLRLVRFPDPARAYRTYPFELSGGLRQRAMIAMALICRPALLVADEPTTALDVTVQAEILALIRDLQREFAMAVMMITHDMGVVANVAEEVVVMYRGEVVESGTSQAVFRNPGHDYLKALLAAVPVVDAGEPQRLKPLVQDAAATPRPRPVVDPAAPVLLSVEALHKSFAIRADTKGLATPVGGRTATVKAVDGVSFDVRRGECLALVGESGCGKTTVSKMIMGAVRPDSGAIRLRIENDATVDLATIDDRALRPLRRRVQYLFQDPFSAFNPRMSVLDLVSEPLYIQGVGTSAERRKRVADLLSLVGIDPRFVNRYPHSFSGGQRQRIGIARALALSPELLILDEPVSALDVSTQAQVLNLLNDLRHDLGLSYIFISHNLAVVNYVADRVAVMCRGRLVEVAPRRALFSAPQHPYTRALLAAAPTSDLDHPLDFDRLRDGAMGDPAAWPHPFDEPGDSRPQLIEVAPGHFVRRHAGDRPAVARVAMEARP